MNTWLRLSERDPLLTAALKQEVARQQNHLELIASENYTSLEVMALQGSCLTNKYAEGYPGKRYYGGCQFVDDIEQLAIARAEELFQATFANVQPHSGSSANLAAYMALAPTSSSVLGMSLDHGGHLTHGCSVNFSGKWFDCYAYGIDQQTGLIDYDQVRDLAKKHSVKLLIAGFSSYSRHVDWKLFRTIADEVGAYLLADMAHVAGLVAADLYPSPVPHAHVVTTTTHKTLRGPRGGLILSRDADLAKKINSSIFPGTQGGPLMHVIAAKAYAFGEALLPEFRRYQLQTLNNARALASHLIELGWPIVSGGTDNHLLVIDLRDINLSGKKAEGWLDQVGLTVNKNKVPDDPRSPALTSGIRVGTPAVTTRGMKEAEMKCLANWIDEVLRSRGDHSVLESVHKQVTELAVAFPIELPERL